MVLCADDYGCSDEVSEGILRLLHQGRLSATSCMTTTASWSKDAEKLLPFKGKVQIGLHFNLTEDQGFGGLKSVIFQALTRRLDLMCVRQAFQHQLMMFKEAMGIEPDFIDGHQHIQHLPGVREVIITSLTDGTWVKTPWVRVSSNGLFHVQSMKEGVIHLIGASALRQLLTTYKIPFNPSFQGVYDFHKAEQFPHLMERFLQQSVEGGLIMCHPGLGGAVGDPIAHARNREFQYLSSDAFGMLLSRLAIQLTPSS